MKKYEKEIDGFGWLNKWDDSRAYLLERTHLACEETANYLVIKCINLAMEEVKIQPLHTRNSDLPNLQRIPRNRSLLKTRLYPTDLYFLLL